ncbi:fatty acid synthase alpha subunit Lsd1 [Coemansia sp. RSA 1972]|nr:fatty acid synthase alpha subunit Lsd1 [Coemansia sp. RSA 1972]
MNLRNENAHVDSIEVAGLHFEAAIAHRAQTVYSAFNRANAPDNTEENSERTAADAVIESLELIEFAWTCDSAVAVAGITAFEAQHCAGQNVHVVVEAMDLISEQTQEILRLYYAAQHNLGGRLTAPKSALLTHPAFHALAVFGGQGGMDNYMDETRTVFNVYRPLVEDFARSMAEFIIKETSVLQFARVYEHGLDIMRWIEEPESTPEQSYMVSVPVCMPVVGLTQLMQVMVAYKTLGISPAELADGFQWITGHSQGIVGAAVLSMVTDEESFYNVSRIALGLTFIAGVFPQLDYPLVEQPADANNGAQASPMAAVLKLNKAQVESAVVRFNKHGQGPVYLSLTNSTHMHVVSGAVPSMRKFADMLSVDFDTTNTDQTRVPYSQRKARVVVKFLSISGPYHCPLLTHAYNKACAYATERGWKLDGQKLRRPVKTYEDGRDICGEPELAHYLLKCMMLVPVDWPAAVNCKGVTHAVDFGPGGTSGFGAIVHRIHEGRGMATICVGAFDSYGSPLHAKSDLYQSDASIIAPPTSWAAEYSPRLVQQGGVLHIDTRMSRLLGKPPVMVAGMTPSTVGAEFVSAVVRAGYHVELSGGGHFSEPMLRDKTNSILNLVDPGSSITVNSIYINPFLWNIQYPALLAMRREGIPLDGLCIGAGVPSFDVCNEIIDNIRSAGFRHIGLKPGSVATIRLVIKIAQANPTFPILLQWTGGRAGGHHSFEDFHQPILETYGAIRNQRNIVLVAGSGFGGVDDTVPYLTGDWTQKFGCARMPFDGILLGSRMMVAKEGGASDVVKEAIVAAPGISDSEWEQTYEGPAGDIVTVLSEMGEPIHKIATRGVLLWKELDDTIFSLPRDKRLPALLAKKDYIIRRLNDDFQKPWFGKKTDGTMVDLEEMTYAEVAMRLIEVLYVKHQSRWIDVTMRNLVGDYLLRLEERFTHSEGPALLQSFTQIDNPLTTITSILDTYPECYTQLLTTEDVQFFINLCLRPGQKPVPFIPLMDKDFHIWFKKDSLWQSEDVDAVADQDVGRVCILQGPVAVRYSTQANQPAREILDNIYHGQVAALLERYYQGDESKVPQVEYLSNGAVTPAVPAHVRVEVSKTERVFTLPEETAQLPETDAWLQALGGCELNWLRALLTTPIVVQDRMYTSNFTHRVLRPRVGQVIKVKLVDGQPQALSVIDTNGTTALDITIDADNLIHFNLYSAPRGSVCTLELQFQYQPSMPSAPIHEIMKGRNERIKQFYAQVWFEKSDEAVAIITNPVVGYPVYTGETIHVDASDVESFCRAIGNTSSHYIHSHDITTQPVVPMDYAMRVFWPAMCKCLMSPVCAGDLTRLVHVSNEFRVIGASTCVGDKVSSQAWISEVVDSSSGRSVCVQGHVVRNGQPVMSIDTKFLIRSEAPDYACNFQNIDEDVVELEISDPAFLALLRGKEWLVVRPHMEHLICVGTTLQFTLGSRYLFQTARVYSSISTLGLVRARMSEYEEWTDVADVDFECGTAFDNLVLRFLRTHGHTTNSAQKLENYCEINVPNTPLRAPNTNHTYARVSTDHNPIHTDIYFADFVNLPATITHGMWTSACARRTIELVVAKGHPERVRSFSAQFIDMVVPNAELEMHVQHTGFVNGCMHVQLQALVDNVRVLEASAQVEQPRTVFVFTGQGAHAPGMGMALYDTSPAAQRVWDASDAFMRSKYGIPLLHIVRTNPKSLTVHFVGTRGERVRDAYRAMQFNDVDGKNKRPMFPEIDEHTPSYTFSAPQGVLFATQFTQPAMLVCAAAEFAHLKSMGVVPKHSVFAGHSLGEFAGLCAVARVMSPERAAEIGFYRGLIMQQCVERDASGRSNYAMLAVSPARVAPWFGPKNLATAIKVLVENGQCTGLLEIVNYNVLDTQYVVAGERMLLGALSAMLDLLAAEPELPTLQILAMHASNAIAQMLQKSRHSAHVELLRTRATIPIPGIDVPFHSSLLRSGTLTFRTLLLSLIKPSHIQVDLLRNKYIPNLTARPFTVTRDYTTLVLQMTRSPVLLELLQQWDTKRLRRDSVYEQCVARVLLIEVLTYQFASPVRWIETQNVWRELRVERVVEIGPANVLAHMFSQTLKLPVYEGRGEKVEVMCSATDMDALVFKNEPVNVNSEPSQTDAKLVPASVVASDVPADTSNVSMQTSTAPEQIADVPISALEVIRALVSYKLKLKLTQVSDSTTIKDLVGGKSTLQNELMGDLQKEFSGILPDKPEELLLSELAYSLAPIETLGKVSTTLVSRMISSKMPGGMTKSSVCKHFEKFGLERMRQNAVLLVALTMEPTTRFDSEESAKQWLDTVAQAYANVAGITFATRSHKGASGASAGPIVAINSKEFNQAQTAQRQLASRTMHALATYLGVVIDHPSTSTLQDATLVDNSTDVWMQEYGPEFSDGIRPVFSSKMARHYDSYWNWARQDVLELYYDIMSSRVTKIDLSMSSHCLRLMNRVTPALIDMLHHIVWCAGRSNSPAHTLALKRGTALVKMCEIGLHAQPVYQFTGQLCAPRLRINGGEAEYFEVNRVGESSVHDFVRSVCCTNGVCAAVDASSDSLEVVLQKLGLLTTETRNVNKQQRELPPMVHLKSRRADPVSWTYDAQDSAVFTDVLRDMCDNGLTLINKSALVTGCGRGSIGAEVLKGLLAGGSCVVATTSSYSASTARYFQDMYQTHGSRGSQLVLVPFNQASRQDITSLVEYIYSKAGLNWDLDFVLPFAAIPELGHDITELDTQSELAHRAMLTNVMRLVGAIAEHKKSRVYSHPTLVVLPLSPNHGAFGFDGHYSESKLGLETLFSRWHSEPWSEYMTVAGAVIGWTRGTGLMSANNVAASRVEQMGVRTFSAEEMAFCILALLHPRMYAMAARAPVWADMSGRFAHYPHITQQVRSLHKALGQMRNILKAAAIDARADFGLIADDAAERAYKLNTVNVRANHRFAFPPVKPYSELKPLNLEGMVNLDKVVVITGYGEVSPFGNAETRWEMEAFGEYSVEACIELAWIMGLIKHSNGRIAGQNYTGWVDAKTNEPVADRLIKQRYEKHILEHTGIRVIEPELIDGYDPNMKHTMRELQTEHDMEPFEASEEEARQFQLRNGEKVRVWEKGGAWFVQFLKGAVLMVPKAHRFDRTVAAQLPTGWDATRMGIPANIASEVDPITSYALVATTEALVRSGITDPYELYSYMHVSQVGSSTGTAVGGLRSTQRVYAGRMLDTSQAPDVYQETFVSTPPAWINMLLMSSSGPIKTTIGACATGLASIDVAVETIQSGKARVMLAGGTDAMCEESSFEFAQMNATSSSAEEFAKGREPHEMSRPCTTTRSGFVESEGAGVAVLMSASMAIGMGVPVYGVVAMSHTATDKEGRSVPAPGKGVLTSARETPLENGSAQLRVLDLEYRRRQLRKRQKQIDEWAHEERSLLSADSTHNSESLEFINTEAARQHRDALDSWGTEFWKHNSRISPLRGSLSVWNLTVDDIGVASFHGTSTKANDPNESHILNLQLSHLNRTPGNVIPAVCQKHLTGHPKGPASMWMLNGVLQTLRTGVIPGNRNADNIDQEFKECEHVVFPSRALRTPGVKAGLLKSFGFGQVGAECLVVHADCLMGVLSEQQLSEYTQKLEKRERRAYRYWHNTLTGVHPFVQVKTSPPYPSDSEESTYLDPLYRLPKMY